MSCLWQIQGRAVYRDRHLSSVFHPAYFSRIPGTPGGQRGAHGYLASHPDMAAFALGVGPGFRHTEIAQAHQLDIFPLILNMLGLPDPGPLPSDGGPLLSARVKD